MKITRTAASSVRNAPKGTRVDFWLNEAIPQSQEDEEVLAEIRATVANDDLELTVSNAPPFQRCLVSWRQRQDGTNSIVMFSCQAAAILFTEKPEGVLAKTEKGSYGCTLGKIDGRPFVGLISEDRERVLLVVSVRRTVIDSLTSVLFVCKSPRDKTPHLALDCKQGICDRIPQNAELLVIRTETARQAFAALGKYGIAYLEEIPERHSCE